MKFKTKDKVVILESFFPKYVHTDAEIIAEDGMWAGIPWYKVLYWDGSDGAISENALASYTEFYSAVKKDLGGCSCGAHHTSNPNWHLSYCDKSKEEEKDDNIFGYLD
jgi:hypothetical protein